MQGKTHNMVGIACALSVAGMINGGDVSLTVVATSVVAGGFGGLVPDIDLEESMGRNILKKIIKIGMILLLLYRLLNNFVCGVPLPTPVSNTRVIVSWGVLAAIYFIGMHTKHRTFMHSLTVCIVSTLCIYALLPSWTLYYLTGYVSHLLLDLLNKKPEQILWPFPVGNVCLKLCISDGIVDSLLFSCSVLSSVLLLGFFFINSCSI